MYNFKYIIQFIKVLILYFDNMTTLNKTQSSMF